LSNAAITGPGRSMNPDALAQGVLSGQRRALARAITLVESQRRDHRFAAADLLERLAPHSGGSLRVGISGVPGVGKSTFIEALGNHLIDQGHRLAVLSVDPSSAISGGSILGDKTRMETLSRRDQAFIRPSPAGRSLGGVARRTQESLLLCEAAGYDVVFVETVGVGQSETKVADMTDMFVLMLLPGGGDELQGIKRGIVELADLILINKADGDLAAAAGRAAADYRNAIRLLHPRSLGWHVQVLTCSSLRHEGIAQVWDIMQAYAESRRENGEFDSRRSAQATAWMWSETADSLLTALRTDPDIRRRLPEFEAAVALGKLPPTLAAQRLLSQFLEGRRDAPAQQE